MNDYPRKAEEVRALAGRLRDIARSGGRSLDLLNAILAAYPQNYIDMRFTMLIALREAFRIDLGDIMPVFYWKAMDWGDIDEKHLDDNFLTKVMLHRDKWMDL